MSWDFAEALFRSHREDRRFLKDAAVSVRSEQTKQAEIKSGGDSLNHSLTLDQYQTDGVFNSSYWRRLCAGLPV